MLLVEALVSHIEGRLMDGYSYRNFQDKPVTTIVRFEGIENWRQLLLIVEFDYECEISQEKHFRSFQELSCSFSKAGQ